MITSAQLTYGQLAIARDVGPIPRDRWHEANLAEIWALPAGTRTATVHHALTVLLRRHESLRTTYDLSDAGSPRQILHRAQEPAVHVEPATDAHADLDAVLRVQARRPFSLERELPWRVTVVTSGADPTHVVVVNHHIVADGLGVMTLKRDFFAALEATLDDTVSGPRGIVAHERSPAGLRRGAAAIEYWTKVLTEAPPPIVGEPPLTQATLTSRRLLHAARQVAARLRVSLATVVLSAYCGGLLEMTDGGRLMVRLMSSNRFDPRRRDVVTSMNQWISILVDRQSQQDLPGLVRQVGTRTRMAYAYGVYDVDRLFGLLDEAGYRPGQYDSTWSFNFITRNPPGSAPQPPTATDDGTLVWDTPFSSIGPRFYLRAIQDDDLKLVVRVPATHAATAAELIRRMDHLLHQASRSS